MGVIYSATAKTNRMTAVRDLIDAAHGGGGGNGFVQIGTTGMATVLAEFTLNHASGTVSGSVLTFAGFPNSDTAANATGTAAAARILDGNANEVITGLTVGLSASDIILDSISINAGQTVTLNSFTITHA
jgi:hypothetical protein